MKNIRRLADWGTSQLNKASEADLAYLAESGQLDLGDAISPETFPDLNLQLPEHLYPVVQAYNLAGAYPVYNFTQACMDGRLVLDLLDRIYAEDSSLEHLSVLQAFELVGLLFNLTVETPLSGS